MSSMHGIIFQSGLLEVQPSYGSGSHATVLRQPPISDQYRSHAETAVSHGHDADAKHLGAGLQRTVASRTKSENVGGHGRSSKNRGQDAKCREASIAAPKPGRSARSY